MIREMIPWYLTVACIIEAFLFGMTNNVRSDAAKKMRAVVDYYMRYLCDVYCINEKAGWIFPDD